MPEDTSAMEAQVWECLWHVIDPELDEPVTDMGFVELVRVDPDRRSVEVEFRLPTYWCSPNFAFLMAFDMRIAIENISWVRDVNVKLNDHCFGDRINEGVNGSQDFNAVFAEYCNGEDLDAVRMKFQEKAFIRRQETLILALKNDGHSPACIVDMTLESFDSFDFQDDEAVKQKPRYRSLLLSQDLAQTGCDPVFVTWEGRRLEEANLSDYLSRSRGVRINMEFNGALCRGLKDARYKEAQIDATGAAPIKYFRNAVLPESSREVL